MISVASRVRANVNPETVETWPELTCQIVSLVLANVNPETVETSPELYIARIIPLVSF